MAIPFPRAKAPDGTLTLELEGSTIAMGPTLAQQLYMASLAHEPAGLGAPATP